MAVSRDGNSCAVSCGGSIRSRFIIWGAHLDREAVANVCQAGSTDVRESDLFLDVVKRIEATAPGGLGECGYGA